MYCVYGKGERPSSDLFWETLFFTLLCNLKKMETSHSTFFQYMCQHIFMYEQIKFERNLREEKCMYLLIWVEKINCLSILSNFVNLIIYIYLV